MAPEPVRFDEVVERLRAGDLVGSRAAFERSVKALEVAVGESVGGDQATGAALLDPAKSRDERSSLLRDVALSAFQGSVADPAHQRRVAIAARRATQRAFISYAPLSLISFGISGWLAANVHDWALVGASAAVGALFAVPVLAAWLKAPRA